jgi:hypothetical protein
LPFAITWEPIPKPHKTIAISNANWFKN